MTGQPPASSEPARAGPVVPGNHLLARLPAHDIALLAPHMERVRLEHGRILCEPGEFVSHVYFPELGTLLGLFTAMTDGRRVKVAKVDRTRALALVEVMDHGRSLTQAITVMPGPALRISGADFVAAARGSIPIRDMVPRHAEMLLAETMRNSACNAVHTAEQRFARWMLAAHDLVRDQANPGADAGAELPITQEMLGDILGIQRTTVTLIAQRLQNAALVSYGRGRIRVLNRPGLETLACDCNQAVADLERSLME